MAGVLCSMVGASFVTAVAQVIRSKKGIQAVGNAQVSTAQSQFGGASALFDGTGDSLTVSFRSNTDFEFTPGEDFTLEAWVRPAATPSFAGIISLGSVRSGNEYSLYTEGGQLRAATFGGTNLSTTASSLAIGTWYHVAVSRSGTTVRLFLNGTQVDSDTYTFTAGQQSTIKIGSFSDGSLSWNGHIDEIRISDSARYTANFTPSTTPFVNDANTLLLIHANGTNASTFFEDDNGVRAPIGIFAIGSNATVNTTQSNFGGSSLYINGANAGPVNYIGGLWSDAAIQAITNIPNYTNYTVEFWLRVPSSPGFTNLADGDTPASVCIGLQNFGDYPFSWSFGVQNTARVRFSYLRTGFADYTFLEGATTLASNTWYHLAFVKTGTNFKIYINGTESATQTWSGQMAIANHGLAIGSYYRARPNIWMDEIRISSTNRYTANFTAPTAPFVNDANTLLLLHCDGTNASTVFRDDNGIGRAQKACIAVGQAQIDNAQSQFGGTSALFDGSDSRVQIQNHPDFALGTGDFTIEGWYRFHTSANRYNTIFNGSSNAVFPHVFTSTSGDTPPNRFVFVGGSTPDIIQGTQTWAINQWYHIALSRSSGTTRLFINGTLEGSVANSANYTGSAVNIGASSTLTSDLMGWVDEFRISNIARYTANFTPSTTPFQNDANTLVLLHMDGTDASTVFIDDNGTRPT